GQLRNFYHLFMQPFVWQHSVYNMIYIMIIQPFSLSDISFLFKSESFRYGAALFIARSTTDFNSVQFEFLKSIMDKRPHRSCHYTTTLKIPPEPVADMPDSIRPAK